MARVLRGDAPSRRREIARLRDREIARSRAASSWTKKARILFTLRNARRSSGASISAWTSEPSRVLAACIDQQQTGESIRHRGCVSCRLSRRQTCTPNERRSGIEEAPGRGAHERPARTRRRNARRRPWRRRIANSNCDTRSIVTSSRATPRGRSAAPGNPPAARAARRRASFRS